MKTKLYVSIILAGIIIISSGWRLINNPDPPPAVNNGFQTAFTLECLI